MNKWKRILLGVGLVLVLLLALPWLIPLDRYIAQAEQTVSTELGVPVTVGDLHVAVLPSPRLKINQVAVGQKNQVSIEQIVVVPALATLFSETRTISKVKIIKPVIKQDAVDILAGLNANKPDESPVAVTVQQILIEEAMLNVPNMQLPLFNATVALDAGNVLDSAYLESVDGKLKAELKPDSGYHSLLVNASAWTLPAGPPLLIDELKADIALYSNKLEIRRLNARLYQGRANASGRLSWGKTWRTSGRVNVAGLAVREPVRLVSNATRVSGRLFGEGNFTSAAKQPAQLAERIKADFRFKVENGAIYGVDLAKAATLLVRQGQKGGETQFDELSGLLKVAGKQYQFRELKVTSGLIAASGHVKIDQQKELDGIMDVELKRSMSLAAIPLQISGTVSDPVALPTKAALAGAVAGTAIMGPGIGTSLGIKAGSALDKLQGWFGGSDDE